MKLLKQLGAVVLLVVLYLANDHLGLLNTDGSSQAPPASTPPTAAGGPNGIDDTELIQESFDAQRSDVWVQASGTVFRVLPDDNEGSRHQRFLVELRTGQTILIAHNIDLAPKVPLQAGDEIEFRGEYEWNDRGGVVHWTHHDPRGRKAGGWISHKQRTYE